MYVLEKKNEKISSKELSYFLKKYFMYFSLLERAI